MSADETIREAAEDLGAEVQREGDYHFLSVATTPPEGTPEDAEVPWELVSVWGDDYGLYARTNVGHLEDEIDLAAILRVFADAWYAKVYLEPDEDEGGEAFAVEACFPAGFDDATALAFAVQEVADKTLALREITGDTGETE